MQAMWRALLVTMCCVLSGCSLLRAPVDDADAGPTNDDAVPVITAIDGTGTDRAVVQAPALDNAIAAAHRLQGTLRISGEHLDVVTSAALVDSTGASLPLALLEASSSTEREMRLPATVSAALYTLVLVAAAGEAQAQVFLLQGEQGVQGDVGLTSLVDTTPVLPGDACVAGGVAVRSGIDRNRNAILDDDEVDTTQTVCAPTSDSALNCTDDGCVLTHPLIVQSTITADAIDVVGDLNASGITAANVQSDAASFAALVVDDDAMEPSPIGDRELLVSSEQQLTDALASLAGRTIAGVVDITVTQSITMASPLRVSHPDGAHLRLRGASPDISLSFADNGILVDHGLSIESLTLLGGTGTGIFALPGAEVRVGTAVTVSGFGVGLNATAARVSLANTISFVGPAGARTGTGIFASDGGVVRAGCTATNVVDVSHYQIGWLARGNSVIFADRCRTSDVERGFNMNLGAYISGNDANITADGFVAALGNGSIGQFDRLTGTSGGQGINASDGAVVLGSNMAITATNQTLVGTRNAVVQAIGGTGTAFASEQAVVTVSAGFTCTGPSGFCVPVP